MALNERLRRLKGVAIGVSATLALGFWWLVSGAVASTGQQAATTSQQNGGSVTDPTQTFFGSGSALGSASGQVPMLRSGGS